MVSVASRLIVALDTPTLRAAVAIVKRLHGLIHYVKIGSILFTAEGPRAIERMRTLGVEVFLDLKFHDIPSTVEKSCRAAVRHRVSMLTVHASGERPMLEAAVAGAQQEARHLGVSRPRIFGVTMLTSIASSRAHTVSLRVMALATQAQQAGLDGVVASARETPLIRRRLGKRFTIVCPGIRPSGAAAFDQQRTATPQEAIAHGADFLVIGRPITEARDPRAVAQRIVADIEAST